MWVREAAEYLLGELPQAGQPNLYYWYYGTLALFQVQGEAWQRWNAAMQRQLLQLHARMDIWPGAGTPIPSGVVMAVELQHVHGHALPGSVLPLSALNGDPHRYIAPLRSDRSTSSLQLATFVVAPLEP